MITVFLLRLIAHTLMSLYEQASNKYGSEIKIHLIVLNRHDIIPSSFWLLSSSQSYRNSPWTDRLIELLTEIPVHIESMVNRKHITREELVKLNNLLGSRRTGTDQKHLKDFWAFLAQKYDFHYYHTLIHNETGKIVDSCYPISRDDKKKLPLQ